jgi:hypothetical protein
MYGWRGFARAAVVAAGLATANPALGAVEIEGVQFSSTFAAGDVELELSCVGLLRYMYVVKGYVAALYVDREVAATDVLADVPKRLEINYFWDLEGKAIGDAGEQLVARNVDAAALKRLQPQLAQIRSLYEDVRPGDRYALTYVPGRGTELALNGKVLGVMPGSEFARAYFSIWLGEQPMDVALRNQLLRCES